jgi:hypothetical protein
MEWLLEQTAVFHHLIFYTKVYKINSELAWSVLISKYRDFIIIIQTNRSVRHTNIELTTLL